MLRNIVFWTPSQGSHDCHKLVAKALRTFDQKPVHRFQYFDGTVYVPQPGEIVLAMGDDTVAALKKGGIVAKNRTASSLRGRIHSASSSGEYLVTFDHGDRAFDAAKEEEIMWDVRLSERYARTGSLLPETGIYRWVQDFSELISAIECTHSATGQPVEVSGDSETLGKQPYDGDPIISVGFTDRAGFADCLYVDDIQTEEHAARVLGQIKWLLTSPKVKMRGANFKFDMTWFGERWVIECTNLAFDTMLAGSLVDENRSNSLNVHAKLYTALGGYDDAFTLKYDKSRMDLVPRDELLQYMGGDIDAVFRVAVAIKNELLQSPSLTNFYINALHPAGKTFGKLERRGVLADPAKFEALRVELEGEHGGGGYLAELDKRAIKLLPARIRMKYADDLNMSRPQLLKDYFFSPMGLNLKPRVFTKKPDKDGDLRPSTAKTHLSMFFDREEAREMVEIMGHRGMASKVLSTYVKGFLKHLRSDGRFHASYILFAGKANEDDNDDSGTNTGRLSAKDPAMQTVPKHWRDETAPNWAKKLRLCFPAPPGKVIWSTDAAQGELKIAACLSGDEAMLAAYFQGLDLHAVTGAAMMGMPYDEFMHLSDDKNDKVKMEKFGYGRFRAKAANFGLVYTMQAAGFVRYAWNTFKMILTEEQAQDTIDKFFAKYPGLLKWHDAYRGYGHRDGYVCSPLGRVRHLPLINSKIWKVQGLAERQAINAPVQSTLSDMMCMALTEIEAAVPQAEAVAMIHDAALGYCDEDRAEEIGRRIVEIAGNLPLKKVFGWDHQLKFNFDWEHGPSMGEMKTYKMAA